MSISRVERIGLVGVARIASIEADVRRPDPALQHGTTQQRHRARVDHQYAAARYAAQKQYVGEQRMRYPDGNLPPVRAYAREVPASSGAGVDGAVAQLAKVRQLVELRTAGTLDDPEFARLVTGVVAGPA